MKYTDLSVKKKITIAAVSVIILLFIGTVFYHTYENFGWVDSFYFTGITLTTIGYGDLTPTTPLTKIVTVFYAFVGIGMVLFFFSILAEVYIEQHDKAFSLDIKKYTEELKKMGEKNKKKLHERKRNIIEGTEI